VRSGPAGHLFAFLEAVWYVWSYTQTDKCAHVHVLQNEVVILTVWWLLQLHYV